MLRPAWLLTAASPRAAAAADALALVAFVVVGSASHGRGSPIQLFLRTGVPMLASWFAVASLVRTYRRADLRTLLMTWLVSVPIAAVIRSAVSDGPWDGTLLVFVGVALAFTLLFLVGGRIAVNLLLSRRPVRARE